MYRERLTQTFIWSLAVLLVTTVPEVQNSIIPVQRTATTFMDEIHSLLSQDASCVYPPKEFFDPKNSWYSDVNRRCSINDSIEVRQGDKLLCQLFTQACHELCSLPGPENYPDSVSSLLDSVQQVLSNVDTFCAALNSSVPMHKRNTNELAFLATESRSGCKETCKSGRGETSQNYKIKESSFNINFLCILTLKAYQIIQAHPKLPVSVILSTGQELTMTNGDVESLQTSQENAGASLKSNQNIITSPSKDAMASDKGMRVSSPSTTMGLMTANLLKRNENQSTDFRTKKVQKIVPTLNTSGGTGGRNDPAGIYGSTELISPAAAAGKTTEISNSQFRPVSSVRVNVSVTGDDKETWRNGQLGIPQASLLGGSQAAFNSSLSESKLQNGYAKQQIDVGRKTGTTHVKHSGKELPAGSEIPPTDPVQVVKKITQKQLVNEGENSKYEQKTLAKLPGTIPSNTPKSEKTNNVSEASAKVISGEESVGESPIMSQPAANDLESAAPRVSEQSVSQSETSRTRTELHTAVGSASTSPSVSPLPHGNAKEPVGVNSNSVLPSLSISSTTTSEPSGNADKRPPNLMGTSVKENLNPGNGADDYEDNDVGNTRGISGENADDDADSNIPLPNRFVPKSQEPADPSVRNTNKNYLQVFDENQRYRKKDEEDVSFFSYFLTFITVCGVGWLVFHNKKRIIAMVVEGRRPRTARRRSSSGSYRKLENNFD